MSAFQLPLGAARPHANQQLLSDYYLDRILPQRADWRQLAVEAAPALGQLRALYAGFAPSSIEAQTEDDLIKPALAALGHSFEVQAALRTPDGTKKPDYVFYRDLAARDANKGKTLDDSLPAQGAFAVGDAKFWDRPLDSALKAKGGDPFSNKNPSYQIAFYIQHSGLSWGILTNGRRWRLYHKDTAHKLDRFYEVDLPELLERNDPEAFLYFYAFFRRAAFDEHELGLNALLRASAEVARGIGDNLKQQVYTALRHLAQGFLDYGPNQLQPDAATLRQIYDHCLIVLYRLLFVLYAEARELLPLRESEPYRRAYSLEAIKRNVAETLDSALPMLPDSATIWPRLRTLFGIINAGSVPLKVSTFNGGLFDPQRYPFLERSSIGDARLLQALDLLTRVNRQFVDYRDLAERHLGTIYEGLLEYHLATLAGPHPPALSPSGGAGEQGGRERIVIEPSLQRRMVEVARGFRKEPTPGEELLWQALRNHKLDGRRFRRQQPIGPFIVDFFCVAEGLIVEVDGPIHASQYEADRQRQAMLEAAGYRFVRIPSADVEQNLPAGLEAIRAGFGPHTPRPLLPQEEKEELRDLRQGEERGGEGTIPRRPEDAGFTVALVNSEGERHRTGSYYTPDFVVQYIVEQTLRPTLDAAVAGKASDEEKVAAVLAVNVLDPSMGSGHFPVAATEYIARYLIDLNVTPDPDAGGEADLPYWKRRVAQSCIYGVDLNPLAVDLAKLSLWLATAAKDKPLSFLDHHLRCGNAVVGARLADLDLSGATPRRRRSAPSRPLRERGPGGEGQLTQLSMLDDDAFTRSMSTAVGSMWLIEHTAGNTAAEVKEQEQAYAAVREDLTRRYAHIADLATATQGFGLAVDGALWPELVRQASRGRDTMMLPAIARLLAQAETTADAQRFFHWDLEFPEVFFDRFGQPLGAEAGFDAVIGNPPYVRQE
jgi:very-short-patch-repair endonuclease